MSEQADPLAQITLTPRGFAGVLAVLALVTGLVLAIVPVSVAHPANNGSVSCGNTFGGVESGALAEGLGKPERAEVVQYVDMCERAIGNRGEYAVFLFFGGLIAGLGLGVVRRVKPASPGSAHPTGPVLP
ncbi:hypothetical protein [Actinokineospora globicatena]|uniref:hypothetical protein n=1 Tax=Actinokineospora globicatena TaxID=103729 RepID=UPI0020A47096|nr:hypothetical protein [Actinokineospora globicatena]MCP2300728.1 hypothetical protein [Actinokineospora globicatena]GLW77647.1 hypothetical protein Aglo01_21290 [Actinokineospora globicatena]GLW84483.1 hypothetical protein Aglo02_21230 [Actinokineospora globicatena]